MLFVPYSMIQYVVNDEISCTIQTTYGLIFSQESESSVKLLGRESERLQIILLNLLSEKKKTKTKTIRRLFIFSREAHPTWFRSISTALASYWKIQQTATNLFIICIILHLPRAQRSGSHFFRRECRWFWLWSACVRWKHFGPDKKKINNAGWIWVQIMASAKYHGSTKILYPFLIEHFLR